MFVEDEELIRGSLPLTKRDIRALVASRFAPFPGGTFLDIGAGTGGITVTMSSFFKTLIAVEQKKEGIELITGNCRKFSISNVKVIEGRAPECLRELPRVDGIFIGGSGGALEQIAEQSAALLNPRGRVVLNAITLEALEKGRRLLNSKGLTLKDITQVSVTSLEKRGTSHMFLGKNPIFILTAEKES